MCVCAWIFKFSYSKLVISGTAYKKNTLILIVFRQKLLLVARLAVYALEECLNGKLQNVLSRVLRFSGLAKLQLLKGRWGTGKSPSKKYYNNLLWSITIM